MLCLLVHEMRFRSYFNLQEKGVQIQLNLSHYALAQCHSFHKFYHYFSLGPFAPVFLDPKYFSLQNIQICLNIYKYVVCIFWLCKEFLQLICVRLRMRIQLSMSMPSASQLALQCKHNFQLLKELLRRLPRSLSEMNKKNIGITLVIYGTF